MLAVITTAYHKALAMIMGWRGCAEKTGAYIGSPETGLINCLQAREKTPNAPLANNPEACERLYKETVKIISDVTGEDWTAKAP